MLTKDTKGDVPVWMKTCLWNLANALWEVVQGKKSNFNRWKVKTHVLGSMLKKGRIGRQIQVKRVQSWVFYSYMYFFKIEETWACLWADKKEPVEREWTTQKREVWTSSSRTPIYVLTLDHSITLDSDMLTAHSTWQMAVLNLAHQLLAPKALK